MDNKTNKRARNKKRLVKFLEVEEVKKFEKPLVDSAKKALENEGELSPTEKIAIRDFALITLVYSCALRISEACNLKLSEIDLDKKTMLVIDGKGGDRTISIPEPAINILRKWLDIRPEWRDNPYFFTNIKGTTRPGKVRPITQQYYNKIFNKLAEKTGVTLRDGQKPHPHTLRHSRAMEIYDNGTTLDILQALLGHRNLSTTQIYAEVRNEKIVEVQQNVVGGIVTI